MKKPILITPALLLLSVFFSPLLFAQAPANNDCSGAITLSAATPVAGTVWNATASSSIPVGCAIGTPDDDVWYKFTATATTVATISLSAVGTNLAATGAMMQLFSGTCGSLTSLACANGQVGPIVVNGLTNASIYYIRVYSYSGGALASPAGATFTITFTPSIAPSNDECISAIPLPTSSSCLSSAGWLQGATTSTGFTACTGTNKYDVWYSFVAAKTNPTISLSNLGSNISANARMQLFSGLCGSLTSVQCSAGTSMTASSLTVGNTYYIKVYSTTGNATTFTTNAGFNICITDPGSPTIIDSTAALFNMDTVAKNLGYPWEVTYGPDDSLWITEARGYRVLRISATRTQANINLAPQQVLKLPFGSNGNAGPDFDRTIGTWPQGGMEGLAIHPDFKTDPTKQWVYLAYVYSGTCASNPASACYFRSKIVRCRFYYASDAGNPSLRIPKQDTLTIMDTVISNLPGSNDHNSGRLKVGPTVEGPDNKYRLYYTIGDMGAGQFNNATRTNNAQNKDTCEGKILRLNTEPDGDASFGVTHDYNTWRQWIPNDNPFTHSVFTTLRTPIYSYGHRNAQGLAWGNVNGTWRLYSSEHGDQSSDEVNIIQAGKNYGWPKVTGVADNNYTAYDDLTNGFTQNDILANATVNDETTFANNTNNFTKPIFDFFNWTPAQIQAMNTGNIFTWSTIAPSGIDFYNGNIPGWKNSLLVTSLKYGMFRLKLQSTGDLIDSLASSNGVDTFPLLHSWRIRDIAINPANNSGQFWVITDSSGSTSGPTGGFGGASQSTLNGGRILRLTYKTQITLPVNYLTFTGKLLTDKTIRLDWKAEMDPSHSYFEVEKSATNSTFVSIGTVTGNLSDYYLVDPAPYTGNNYYRIKEVNNSGKISYSKVINIVYDPSAFFIAAYPNPIKDILNIKITSPKTDNIQIEITDMQGRMVYRQSRYINIGTTELQVDAKTWAPQLYSLKIKGSDNNLLTTQKIIKQ